MIKISNLYSFPLLGGFCVEVKDLEIYPLQKIGLIGQTGSGKTTLLKMIAGLVQFERGEYLYQNQKILGPDHKLMPGIKGIAYLSQQSDLWNNYWVEDILDYMNRFNKDETEEICKICKIDHLFKRNSKQLSGGEKQRIALVKLLLERPQVLILDEPYTNLDFMHKKILKEVVEAISKRFQVTCILTSHDALDLLSWADEIFVLKEGKIIEHNNPEKIYKFAKYLYTAALFGEVNELNSKLKNLLGIQEEIKYLHPHQIQINEQGQIDAVVLKQTFTGAYYLTQIQVEQYILLIQHPVKLDPESIVKLSIVL